MVDARVPLDLEDNIKSGKGLLGLTQEEKEVILNYKVNAEKKLWGGLFTGAALSWAAWSKLDTLLGKKISGVPGYSFLRMGSSFVAGAELARWCYRKSIDSSLDHMLSLHGTWLQRELATRIVRSYQIQNDHSMIPVISKHFYSEEVYDDSSPLPRLRLRLRNFFSDKGMVNDFDGDSHNATSSGFHDNFDREKTDFRSKQTTVNPGVELMMDPLDCVFGYMATAGEIHQSSTSSVPSRAQSRAHRRAHRRRRLHHQKASLGSHDE